MTKSSQLVEWIRPKVRPIIEKEQRFPVEAYAFIFEALEHTLSVLGVQRHVTGQELCHGVRDMAIQTFGPLAGCVFRQWGIQRTGDIGDLVYSLIEIGLMGKTDSDTPEHFEDVFDLPGALEDVELVVQLA